MSGPGSLDRVCALCGTSLTGRRRQARFCSRACRVEAGRIRAILSPSNPEPYGSVAERLKAAQKPSKAPLPVDPSAPSEATGTAMMRLLAGARTIP